MCELLEVYLLIEVRSHQHSIKTVTILNSVSPESVLWSCYSSVKKFQIYFSHVHFITIPFLYSC